MQNGNTPHVHDDEEEADHCACDIELVEGEATSDAELPPAVGGIEAAQEELDDEDHIDGCELDFNESDPTTDEELPVTVGGV
jgi:hypothetical protein